MPSGGMNTEKAAAKSKKKRKKIRNYAGACVCQKKVVNLQPKMNYRALAAKNFWIYDFYTSSCTLPLLPAGRTIQGGGDRR